MKPFTTSTQLISYADFAELPRSQYVLIDARGGAGAFGRYLNGHLMGAYFADLETDLSAAGGDASIGGRHPLPDPTEFAEFLTSLGITPETFVIVYDDKAGANAAARLWWMLAMGGHKRVSVLDGGMEAAVRQGALLNKDLPEEPEEEELDLYPLDNWSPYLADINEVAIAAADPEQVVIDVREAYRFNGESEPIDLVAGHIPGAVNIPYIENLQGAIFLTAEELALKYAPLFRAHTPEKIIVHCGSGVTACHTVLAMAEAGLPVPKVYIGSWGEWSRTDRPVAKTE